MLIITIALLFISSAPAYAAPEQSNKNVVIMDKDCLVKPSSSGVEFVCKGRLKNIGDKDVTNLVVSVIDPNAEGLDSSVARLLGLDKESTSDRIGRLRAKDVIGFTIRWSYLIPPLQLGLEEKVRQAIRTNGLRYEISYEEIQNPF